MIKYIAAGLIVLCSASAVAGTVARAPNNGGGYINLTDSSCASESGMIVYTHSPGGITSYGCYIFLVDDGMTLVRWSDGEISTYKTSNFAATDYYRRTYVADSKTQSDKQAF